MPFKHEVIEARSVPQPTSSDLVLYLLRDAHVGTMTAAPALDRPSYRGTCTALFGHTAAVACEDTLMRSAIGEIFGNGGIIIHYTVRASSLDHPLTPHNGHSMVKSAADVLPVSSEYQSWWNVEFQLGSLDERT